MMKGLRSSLIPRKKAVQVELEQTYPRLGTNTVSVPYTTPTYGTQMLNRWNFLKTGCYASLIPS